MKTKILKHAPLNYFPAKEGSVYISGKSINQVINMVGQTPLYVYDRHLITQRVSLLKKILPSQIQLHYAVKANPMPAIVQHFSKLVDGLDVASHTEMLNALNSGMPASQISFAGPGKTDQELHAAIASEIIINIESKNELKRINLIAQQQNIIPNIALRVNPDFELKGAGVKMSGGAKPFGIDAEDIPELLSTIKTMHVNFIGLHIFTGSQNLNTQAIMETHEKTFALAAQLLKNNTGKKIDFQQVDSGGGLGIPYVPGDEAIDIQAIANNLDNLLKQYPIFINKKIILELGRYLVGEAGIYVSQIIDKKQSRGQIFLITNGGLNHHLANSGNFGQVIRKNYPVMISKKTPEISSNKEKVTIVGPLCTSLDILAQDMELPEAAVGDYVVILQSGAYGKTASPENFLSHDPVKEILI